MVLMQKPSVINAPSGGAREKAPRWDLTGTEGCGGGIRFSWIPLMVWGYVGIYRRKKYVGGATWAPRGWRARPGGQARPLPRALLVDFLTQTPSPLDHVCSENHVPKGFIPFGLRLIFFFCETLKQAKNSNSGLGLRLIGQSQNNIKVYNKAH